MVAALLARRRMVGRVGYDREGLGMTGLSRLFSSNRPEISRIYRHGKLIRELISSKTHKIRVKFINPPGKQQVSVGICQNIVL